MLLNKIRFRFGGRLGDVLARVVKESRANVAVMFGLAAPVLLTGLGVGMETGNWYFIQRNMQDAADAAAIAAATNDSASYGAEADATTATYGYVDGSNSVVVTASNTASCPTGGNNCYNVTITKPVPLYLAQLLYGGNTTVNGRPGVLLQASATATQVTQSVPLCLLALGQTQTAVISNGAPDANLANCSVMSDSDATCNGHNLGATYGLAHGQDNGCGITEESNVPIVQDPYAALAKNIPANTCSSYPQEPAKNKDPSLPSSNLWSGNVYLGATTIICGDLQLTGDTTINDTSGPAVLVIENGQLDTNGYTLATAGGSYVTIIFSGDNSGTYTHAPTGGGTIDIQAPTSGVWSGVALYQDPGLTSGVDISAAGNSPTWDITGLVYLPNADVTFSGAVNKSSNGSSCFVMVVNNLTINGTGSILETGGCDSAGLNMPQAQIPGRGQLVM